MQTPLLSTPSSQPKDLIFGGMMIFLFFISILFPNFFAYSPLLLGLTGFAFYPQATLKSASKIKFLGLSLAILAGMAFLSALWSEWSSEVLPRAAKIAVIMACSFLLCCVFIAKREFLRHIFILRALIVTWIIVATIIAIDQYFNFPFYRAVESIPPEEFVGGSETNRNIYALLLSGWLLLYASLTQDQSTQKITIFLRAAIIIFLPLLLFKSWNQAAQLSLVLSLLALALFPYKWVPIWKITRLVLALFILAAPFIALALYNYASANYQLPDQSNLLTDAAVPQRLEIWSFLSTHILNNPVLGYGLEATRFTIFDTPQIFWHSQTVLHPHNFALQLWIEWGALGALIGAILGIKLMSFIQKQIENRTDMLIMAAFITALCAISFSYGLWQSHFLGLNLFMLALSLIFIRRPAD